MCSIFLIHKNLIENKFIAEQYFNYGKKRGPDYSYFELIKDYYLDFTVYLSMV